MVDVAMASAALRVDLRLAQSNFAWAAAQGRSPRVSGSCPGYH